jgi:hypothetical protein
VNTPRLFSALSLLALLFFCATSKASIIEVTRTLSSGYSNHIVLPGFDSSLGTLTAVDFVSEASLYVEGDCFEPICILEVGMNITGGLPGASINGTNLKPVDFFAPGYMNTTAITDVAWSASDLFPFIDSNDFSVDLNVLFNPVTGIFNSFDAYFQNGTARLIYTYSAVPIPPAMWLFGSGLLGLVGIARRKNVN